MSPFFLERGLVILREGRQLELHHRTSTALYFEDPISGDIEAIAEEQFWRDFERQELIVQDAVSSPKALELPSPDKEPQLPPALSEKHAALHLRKLNYVGGIRQRGISKGQIRFIADAIPDIAKEIGDTKPPKSQTVAEWMRKLERAQGNVYALVSKHACKRKRERQDANHEALISRVVEDHLGKEAATNIREERYLLALKNLNTEQEHAGLPVFKPISIRSFQRRIHALDRYDVAVARHGRQEARRMFRMIKGHMPSDRPLDYVEIDHAKLRLWVIDDFLLLPIGRPWVTALKDRNTGMLIGFYISFRGPSLASIFGAIRHSLSSHLDLNKIWPDLEHPWVASGLACTYVSDRGADFLSPNYQYALRQLGSDYSYCESRTAWHKPHIERTFLSMHADMLEALPGEVYKGLAYNRDYNPKEDAVVRFSTLVYLLVKWAVDYHPYRPRGKHGPRPIDLWMDGIGDAPSAHVPNPDALNIILGRSFSSTLHVGGVQFRYLYYANDELERLFRAIDRKKLQGVIREENLGRVHIVDPRDQRWFEVGCTRPDYAEGLSLYQHQYLLRQARIANESVRDVDQLLRFRTQVQERIAEDLTRKDSATKARIAHYAGIDSAAVLAGRPKSLANITPDKAGNCVPAASNKVVIPDAAFMDVPMFQWGIA